MNSVLFFSSSDWLLKLGISTGLQNTMDARASFDQIFFLVVGYSLVWYNKTISHLSVGE